MRNVPGLVVFLLLVLWTKRGIAQAVISVGQVIGQITSCQGSQSDNQQYQYFILLGFNLTGPVTVQATDGFVVSTVENAGFESVISVNAKKGAVTDTLYVRLGPSAPVGVVKGTVTVASNGVSPQTLGVNGTVLPMPVAYPEPNITVLDGTTLPRLNFEGTNSNTYLWTTSNPNIGLPASGIDSLPQFRVLTNSTDTVKATITITPVLAGMAYVTDNSIGSVSAINTLTNTLDTTISSGGKNPTSETLSPDGAFLYVLQQPSNTIAVINTATNTMVQRYLLPMTGFYRYQLAINHDGSQLYVIDFHSGDFTVLDAHTGAFVSESPTFSADILSETAFSPTGKRFYIGANENAQEGNIYVFNVPAIIPASKIPVPFYTGDTKLPPFLVYLNMVVSPDSTRLYVTTGFGEITVVNTVTQKNIATIQVGKGGIGVASGVAISPDGRRLYAVVNGFGDEELLQVFNTADNALLQTITFQGSGAEGICISPDGTHVYISCSGSNTVEVINTETYLETTSITIGGTPEINTFCIKPGGCFGNPVTFTITINPAPVPTIILSADTLTALTTTYGTPSQSESFNVSGKLLRSAITVAAPKGFEISLDNNTFSSTVIINTSGAVPGTTVYVRLAAADVVAIYTGFISLTSPGAGNGNVFIPDSPVTPAALTITANSKSKVVDAPNPVLNASYKGFQNGDTPVSLVYPPALSTTAVINSPVGTYPIIANNAYSANYNISYIRGTLTITPDIIIPNAFTPNGDGINDTWDIQKIGNYPDCSVQVFNRYGLLVFSSTGYSVPWDGTYKGATLTTGTCYYIINLYAGIPVLSGFVTIIR